MSKCSCAECNYLHATEAARKRFLDEGNAGHVEPTDGVYLGDKRLPLFSDAIDPEYMELANHEWELWKGKGDEYRVNDDRLSNFTTVAQYLGVSPLQVWAVYAAKHWFAVINYIKTGAEGMEGIESRLADLAVYMKLARMLVRREKK